jgi:predicted ATPase
LDYIIPGAGFDNAHPLGKSKVIEGTFRESLPTNVGFGISYVLPIIVNGLLAKENSIFIIENPEAHLHPGGQSRIGRFLAKVAASGIQVIIETHSEHVLNGVKIECLTGSIPSNDVVINFLSRNKETKDLNIQSIGITESGDLTKFPRDFFDQVQQDMAESFRLRKKNQNG